MNERIPVLYLAPWVGYGGSDKNTIDWFRWIDRERFAPYLITTQPSPNPLIEEVAPFAEEVWVLPDLMAAEEMPAFILDFLQSRDIRVVHLMNSRIGFDLLPDFTCLPSPPSIVVQLHVEEVDRSGYVRYVTTRYGNLVDGFSISNEHVAGAVHGYGIPRDKIKVIYTGADADEEFSPERSAPIEELPDDRLNILFAARLVPQKDPLLMIDVAAGLRDRGARFQVHVVGEGELEGPMKERIAELGLADEVRFHPPTPGLQRWYAATDTLLLTSEFEGVPCVLFEAMAMGLPIVAPDLPGIRELLHEDSDGLIEPRDSVEKYVEPLAHLAEDREHRRKIGAQMRERAQKHFSVQQMASSHGEMYEELVAAQEKPESEAVHPLPEPIRFLDRPPAEDRPLVSVLVPHFNQARFLEECVYSIKAQTYPNVEVVVVDDASTEDGTAAALDALEGRGDATVVRLSENGGPSRARNAGLEHCSGRYVLPVDSDNLLLPDAIEKLVEQLAVAGEKIGFIYPNLQYFGNREDYYEVPEYNLYTLLHGNFCDTCSLIDREVFDAGLRYSEEIRLGHEDWDFVLRLAAHGIRGEAAREPTVLYRKWGFNRSDVVDHAPDHFLEDVLTKNSPFRGREAQIKAQESPALSVVALSPVGAESDSGRKLAAALERQSCIDMELVIPFSGDWSGSGSGPSARRSANAGSTSEYLQPGLESARGAFVAVTSGTGASLLSDRGFCEKVLRRFAIVGDKLDAIAFADAGPDGRFGFRALPIDDGPTDPAPHAVVWRRKFEQDLPHGLMADPTAPVKSLTRLLSGSGAQLEWRHLPLAEELIPEPKDQPLDWVAMPEDPATAVDPYHPRPAARPLLPGEGKYRVPRWELTPTWIPPLSTIAIRYREHVGERRLVTNGEAPASFRLEHFLGALRSTGVQGTKKVVRIEDTYRAIPREGWKATPLEAVEIGYAEEAPLPGFDTLALAVHRESGQHILVSLPDDPLLQAADVIEHLGFMDPFPLRPRDTPSAPRTLGLVGLLKGVDYEQKRHRYAIGTLPGGELLAEVGGLAESGLQGSVGVWIVDGYLVTEQHGLPAAKYGRVEAARWAAEPVVWRDLGPAATRARTIARRAGLAAVHQIRSGQAENEPAGEPDGWLFESARPGLSPLYASYHPVTGDQLLTRATSSAEHLGYRDPRLLGFLRAEAPLTGDLEERQLPIPWARRSGAVPRTG